jgi:hypothetical protein
MAALKPRVARLMVLLLTTEDVVVLPAAPSW